MCDEQKQSLKFVLEFISLLSYLSTGSPKIANQAIKRYNGVVYSQKDISNKQIFKLNQQNVAVEF